MKNAVRQLLALSIPVLASALQWVFWPAVRPFVWFLFYPAVFFSSWVGGLYGGLAATAISTALVWWFFIPLVHASALRDPKTLISVAVFMGMGVLFSLLQGRLRKANRLAAEALEAARMANDDLQDANEKITKLYEKTRELDDLKTQFFANVSHELRTPLALVLGPVDKLLASGCLTDEGRQDLEVVQRNARLLYRHVTDLLDVAKIEAGRMTMQYSVVDLAGLVRFMASHFEVIASEKEISFRVETPETLPARIDSEKCRRILLNLLSNAFKFTPARGDIGVSLRREGERAVIEVQDNGPGVPSEMHEAVFERFRQVEGGAERCHGGTGLGLAIVKELVEIHDGTIEVGDAVNGGALFSVTLPLESPEGTCFTAMPTALDEEVEQQVLDELRLRLRPAAATPTSVSADAELVLVAEDNPDMRAYLAQVLGRNYRVFTASDGEDCLAKALSVHPDLIVTDIMMPRMSGDQMVEALRRHPETEDVPVLVLTAKADDNLRLKMLKERAQEFLLKPFSDEELLVRAERLLTHRRKLENVRAGLSAIVECSEDAIIGKTLEGIVTSWNGAAQRLFGYSREEALGKSMFMLFPEDRAEEEQAILARVGQGERVGSFDTVGIGKDGKPRDVSVAISPIKDGLGRIVGASTIARDISERKESERLLLESEKQLRLITETIPNMLWTGRADGYIDYCNRRWLDFTGMTHDAIQGNGWMEALPPEDVELIGRSWMEGCRQGGSYELEHRMQSADGRYHWFLTRAFPIKNDAGEVLRWYGTNTDITRLKQAQDTLRANEESLHLALDAAKAGTWEWDLTTNENYWSKELWKVYGLEPHSCEPSYETWRQTVHPDDLGEAERLVREASAKGTELCAEWRVIDPDGGERWLMSRGQPLFGAKGQPMRYLGVVIDITERKRSEIELRNSHREKVVLLREIHHRVKNNLQIVMSILGLQADSSGNREVREILEDTRNRVRSMAILHEVLYRSGNLASISFGTYIEDLCRQIITFHGQLAQRVNLHLRVSDVVLPLEQAVPCGLIINELVSNALKHGFPDNRSGSVTIEFNRTDEQMLLLRVRDDGVGMPPGIDPANTSTLGLLMVHELTNQLLGHLTLESTIEGGTDFRVAFSVHTNHHLGGEG